MTEVHKLGSPGTAPPVVARTPPPAGWGAGGAVPAAVAAQASAPAPPPPQTPNIPTGLNLVAAIAAVTVNWTVPLTDSTHDAATGYNLRYSLAGAGIWTTIGSATTGQQITGLTAGASYDIEVRATNSASAPSAWTAAATAATLAASNYLLTSGWLPTAGSTWARGTGGIACNVIDNSTSADGSHTLPAMVDFAWSSSGTTPPTTGLAAGSPFSNGGHSMWAYYATAPSSAGNYFIWAIALDAGSNPVAHLAAGPFAIT